MFAICAFLILSASINSVELETLNQNPSFNQSDEHNYEINTNELNQETANTISQFTFNDKNLDYSLLNRYILENNNIYLPDNQVNQQDPNEDQQNNDHRSKVYLFKPKQISETTSLESDQGLRHLSHLSLPTKSTLSKSFPKLYKQLYQLDKSPLQQNLNQFFRSNMDDLSASQRLNDPFKQINPERIEVFAKTLQALPLSEKSTSDRNKVSSNMVRFQSVDTFADNKTEVGGLSSFDDENYEGRSGNSEKSKNSIRSESSNKNESLIKNEAKNQTSVKIDDLFENQNKKLNRIKKGKKLTYKDLRALSPIEFKSVKIDKAKFNSKRYVPKIIYSKTKKGSNKQSSIDNELKIVPISYVPIDDNLLLNQLIDNSELNNQNSINFATTNLPDMYPLSNLGLIYNLNSLNLIGTLIDNLISNLPANLLNNFSNDLPPNLPDNLNSLLIANNVNKRLDLLNKKLKKKRKEEIRMKEKSSNNRAKNLLSILEIKELHGGGGAGFNDAILEKMKSNSKSDINILEKSKGKYDKKAELHAKWLKWLNNLTRMDIKKLESLNKDIRQSNYVLKNEEKINFTKPNCLEFNNSTICFTGIEN